MRLRTIVQLRERVRRYAGQQGNAGAFGSQDVDENIVEAWEWVWARMTAHGEGYGETVVTVTAVGGETRIAVPAAFRDLRSIFRLQGNQQYEPEFSSRRQYVLQFPDLTAQPQRPGYYWLEAPTQADPTGEYIELRPTLTAGERIVLSYTSQAPLWPLIADPGSPGEFIRDPAAQVNVLVEELERALVWLAAAVTLQRDDPTARAQAEQRAERAIFEIQRRHGRRNSAQPISIHQIQNQQISRR